MTGTQLEFNIDNETPENVRFSHMQKQIDAIAESAGKVRRKLFAELALLKKDCASLKDENSELKKEIRLLKNEKTEWLFCQDGLLLQEA